MSLYVTTQSYRNDIPTEYGYLIEVDKKTGSIIRKKRIDTPVKSTGTKERIKPGLRGIYFYNNEIYVASWNMVFILDITSLEIKKTISHKWMSDLHGIFVNKNGIWVTSSLPDAVILYNYNGEPMSSIWLSETCFYTEKETVDKTIDWREKGKNFRGFKEYHANHVSIKGGYVYITGRGKGNGRIIKVNEKEFLNNQTEIKDDKIKLFAKQLHGPHDGIWYDKNLWVTETLGSTIASINKRGKIKNRKKILESENEKIIYDSFKELIKYKLKQLFFNRPGLKITHWTRGLAIDEQYLYVGQSTKAGDQQSRARIIKVNKHTMKISDCFYLDIEDYPETRIFQIDTLSKS